MSRIVGLLLLLLLLLGRPAGAAAQSIPLPVVVESGNVTVRAEAGLERAAARVARQAPGWLAGISTDLAGLPVPAAVEIRLVKRAENLASVAPPGHGAPPWAVGVAYPEQGVVAVAALRGGELLDVDSITRHELAHAALSAALGGRAPRWLDEGFAYQWSSDFSLARAGTLTGLAWSGNVLPLPELEAGFPPGEQEASVAYAQSYDFVGFLAARGRWADRDDDGDRRAFRRFLAELALGRDTDAAAVRAFGVPMSRLFEEWFADLRDRYLWYPVGLGGLLLWAGASLLLVLGWWRRRRQARVTLARWEREERAADGELPS